MGKMPTASARRFISLLRRSRPLVARSVNRSAAHRIIQCSHLMARGLQLCPDDILKVDRERPLAEPEAQTRAILSFLDLP